MTPEQVLALRPKVLTQAQRESYFNDGFLLVERAISDDWIRKLRAATDELVERGRKVTKSDAVFDLEPGHRPDAPRLRRVSNPVEQHPVFWEYCLNSVMADIVADLVGADVKFHHSKLNFKWANGGEEVKWHYDISFYPHTNYSPLTVGTYLHDCGAAQGPLGVLCFPLSRPLITTPASTRPPSRGRPERRRRGPPGHRAGVAIPAVLELALDHRAPLHLAHAVALEHQALAHPHIHMCGLAARLY